MWAYFLVWCSYRFSLSVVGLLGVVLEKFARRSEVFLEVYELVFF